MTPREKVGRARRRLIAAILGAALLWAATAGMAVLAGATALDKLVILSGGARAAIIPLAALAALGAAAAVLWRARGARSIEGVALWVEERDPALRYAFATAVDPIIAPAALHPELHRIAAAADTDRMVVGAARRGVGWPLVTAVTTGVGLAILNPTGVLRSAERALVHRLGMEPANEASRLAALAARVVPPTYSRLPARTLREPSNVQSLVGSAVTLLGNGEADGIRAVLDSVTYQAHPGEEARGWAVGIRMPKAPAVVALHDRAHQRLVTLEPVTDSAPEVHLLLPLHDTTYQTVPRGPLAISASLSDDIGLNFGYVEYMLTAGNGESFTTKLINGPHIQYDNARTGTLRTSLQLDTMNLKPGHVLHIRVVAYDYNDVTGPGIGVSETRTLRIAEPLDSTSINPAPPLPIDSMWISQRLLNMKTDTLIRAKRRLTRAAYEQTSSGYSNAQETIRQKALAVIGVIEQTGEGSSFQTEVSTKLREAVDLMWTAREDLGIALPDTAMPYMIRILKILDEMRLANRYYMRGILKPVPVNVARVRLTGKDAAHVGDRSPREALSDVDAVLIARLDAAAAVAHGSPGAAADSLVYVRAAALTGAPAIAPALQRAIDLLRRGAPADSALALVRLMLEPPARVLAGPPEWGGIVP